jgi:cytidine deaminase
MFNKLFLLSCLFCFSTIFAKDASIASWKLDLLKSAKDAKEKSYSPYSKYKVGSAIVTKEGKIYKGTNIENASYGLTICAERSCIFAAISSGEKNLKAIAIVTKDGGSPCACCRQVLNEFNPDIEVIIANENFTKVKEYTLKELLPDAFGPKNLN